MTRKEAVRECKLLWEEIEESGLSKLNFLASPAGVKWFDKEYQDNCPLCNYVADKIGCDMCPLVKQYGKRCGELGYGSNPPDPEFFETVRNLEE